MNLLYQRIGRHEGISRLLRHFYADVRQDLLIGPIFNAKIKDWKHHLDIITSFWETLIARRSAYARPMPMKHLPLRLREEDFEPLAGKLSRSIAWRCRERNDRLGEPYHQQTSLDSWHLSLGYLKDAAGTPMMKIVAEQI
jgi:truncated hemoglobin YjbI